tara:strand:- start:4916 stop:5152 length:237 start_codon:yes stop_codon:yes gene_type:complete
MFKHLNMHSSALGLTCHKALDVFAANETLRLQARVVELEKQNHSMQIELQRWEIAWSSSRTYSPVCPYGLDMFDSYSP